VAGEKKMTIEESGNLAILGISCDKTQN